MGLSRLSLSQFLSLLSLFVSPMAFSSSFFNSFFRLVLDCWVSGFTLFFFFFSFFLFFFNIYMGSSLADSVGWFRIFGGGPRPKRKEGPKSSSYYFGGKFTY